MPFETLQYQKDGRLARLTLNRPRLLNAMNYQATLELNRAAEEIRDDPEVRFLVIRGAGRAFCTGIDLKELAADETPVAYFEQWERALRILERMDKIVLCAMHGYALGGGLQLAIASDIRVATEDCLIGLPATKESFIPGLGTYRLPRFIGLGRAKRMVLSGENIDGRQAHEFGLVDHVVSADAFDHEVEVLVDKYLKVCSEGTRQSKVLFALQGEMSYGQFLEEYLHRQVIAMASPDHDEAMTAYREGREPVFTS